MSNLYHGINLTSKNIPSTLLSFSFIRGSIHITIEYNKDLFEQAGLDPNTPPTTYEEMMVMAEELSKLETAEGNSVYAFGQTTAFTRALVNWRL